MKISKNFLVEENTVTYIKSLNDNDLVENHCHKEIELLFIYEGYLDLVIEDKKFYISKPCLIVFSPSVYHSVIHDNKTNYERITLTVNKNKLPKEIYYDFIKKIKDTPILELDEIIRIAKNIKEILLNKNDKKYSKYIQALIIEIIYIILLTDNHISEPESNPLITNIINYINANLCKMITVSDISKNLFISQSTICHTFKKYMNISVKQYIIQKKIKQNLLKTHSFSRSVHPP